MQIGDAVGSEFTSDGDDRPTRGRNGLGTRGETRWPAFASVLLSALGALVAVGVAAALWAAPQPLDAVQASAALRLHTSELSLALSPPSAPDHANAQRSADALDLQIQRLARFAADSPALASALAPVAAQWSAVRATLPRTDARDATLGALRSQATMAQTLAHVVEADFMAQRMQRYAALATASLITAAILVWAGLAMRRHRHHLKRLMRQFSEALGTGDWQDAVQTLRSDHHASPSAFDALASGVESVLGESDRRWQALADLAADWYWESDRTHRLAWMSGAAPPITAQGWSSSQVLGHRFDAVPFFEPPAQGWERFYARLEARKGFRELEFRVKAQGRGEPIWVAISGRPRQDISGRFAGYEGVGRDVTERRLAHEQMRASEQRWSMMAGLASDFYWETDAEHRLLPLAPEVTRRFGEAAERLVGKTRWEAHADALTPARWAEHRADLEARRPFRSLQWELHINAQSSVWISVSGIPRFDTEGKFLGYHGVGRDVTMRREAERLLLRHNEELQTAVAARTQELEQVNRDLDAFARQLAHELRTPIGHVHGLAHLLKTRASAQLEARDHELLDLQVQAARQMGETVDALLLLARSSLQPMPMETLDLTRLVHAVIAELPALQRAGAIEWQVQNGMLVVASPAALRIVLTNLLSNAAKFTRQVARPQVQVGARGEADGRLMLSVQDNGAGFEMAHVDRLFKPFNRLHRGEEFQGTGIGLTIVQRIVERHGGKVRALGRPGAGACFEITLTAPGKAANAATAQAHPGAMGSAAATAA